jgi:C-terminal processing protease CtpA/Prc
MSSRPNIIELLAKPKLAAMLVERERAARRPVLGWSGLAMRFDPQIAMFGDRVEVTVHPKSSAYRAGMRTGDVVIGGKIHVAGYGDVPLQNLDRLKLPAGTEITVRFCRPGAR